MNSYLHIYPQTCVELNTSARKMNTKKLLALSLTILSIYPINYIMESKKLISLVKEIIKDFIKMKAKVSLLETKVNQLIKEKKHDRYN